MGQVIIQKSRTCLDPITLMGEEAGICWGGDISDPAKNFKRGMDCLESNHGRVMEFPQIYLVLDEYSARVIREYYTHIGGDPTRLQASTRYIQYGNFGYIVPPSIEKANLKDKYDWLMSQISETYREFEAAGIPKEDIANILPLGMETKVVVRTNLRQVIDMSRQRDCSRAYWEFRGLMRQLEKELSNLSKEWTIIVDKYFGAKCEFLGYCPEKFGCGHYEKKI